MKDTATLAAARTIAARVHGNDYDSMQEHDRQKYFEIADDVLRAARIAERNSKSEDRRKAK